MLLTFHKQNNNWEYNKKKRVVETYISRMYWSLCVRYKGVTKRREWCENVNYVITRNDEQWHSTSSENNKEYDWYRGNCIPRFWGSRQGKIYHLEKFAPIRYFQMFSHFFLKKKRNNQRKDAIIIFYMKRIYISYILDILELC